MKKILLIDDDKETNQIFHNYLTELGYDMHVAYDGIDGINKMSIVKPDLVLLDFYMPGANGYDVMYNIQKNYSVPIIFISSDEINSFGYNFLKKPFSLKKLEKTINVILVNKF